MHELTALGLALALLHFAVPLAYYWYLKRRYLCRPWNLKLDTGYRPRVTVIVPTYMGARYIAARLENLYSQDYPRDKVEVVVVDSASPDGTAEKVREWVGSRPGIDVKLVVEPERRGKFSAILEGLKYVAKGSEVVVFTDDDCLWDRNALRNVVKYLADPAVGAVTSSIRYTGDDGVHNTHRDFYNRVRVAESKWWSTPVHNGPLLAVRKKVLENIGLPRLPGADDSAFGSYIAFAGYRAIQVDDVYTYEPLVKGQRRRMVRRATHLVTYFRRLRSYAKTSGVYRRTEFETIWRVEAYLHIVNPLLLLSGTTILVARAILLDLIALALLLLGVSLLLVKTFRMWITHQLYLVIGLIRSLATREATWSRAA